MSTNSIYQVNYGNLFEEIIVQIEQALTGNYIFSKRSISLLLLQNDGEIRDLIKKQEKPEIVSLLIT